MPKLMVIYDPKDRISGCSADVVRELGVKEASLSVADDLEGNDIYSLAKKLAEMLLEQL